MFQVKGDIKWIMVENTSSPAVGKGENHDKKVGKTGGEIGGKCTFLKEKVEKGLKSSKKIMHKRGKFYVKKFCRR